MKKLQSIQRIIGVLIIGALSLVIVVPASVHADEYGYEKKDNGTEQARYISKLTEDKKKVDLAILNTKALIHKARNKPYLPELYLRLAELYIEQSRIVYYVRRTQKGEAASAFDQVESNAFKNQALEIYQRILNDFPEFKSKDKVHFFMAHEYRELNQIDDMVVQYRTIIKDYPDSPYVSESYLLLGDYFISKQDLETAKKHYEAILKYPGCTAISIARYKLGWCYINQLKFQEALKLFEDVVLRVPRRAKSSRSTPTSVWTSSRKPSWIWPTAIPSATRTPRQRKPLPISRNIPGRARSTPLCWKSWQTGIT